MYLNPSLIFYCPSIIVFQSSLHFFCFNHRRRGQFQFAVTNTQVYTSGSSLRFGAEKRMAGIIGGRGSCSLFEMKKDPKKKRNQSNGFRVNCVSTVSDPYKTLKIHPGASESEVKKAFRKLALQYHPDVCRGSNCGTQFHQINEAYDAVMSSLREDAPETTYNHSSDSDAGIDEPMRGMYDQDWDMWEEWMGWEGAGIRDYSSHINPYI